MGESAAVYGDGLYLATATTVYAFPLPRDEIRWKTILSTAQYGPIDGPWPYPAAASTWWFRRMTATSTRFPAPRARSLGRRRGRRYRPRRPGHLLGHRLRAEGRGQGAEGGGFDICALQVSDGRLLWRSYAGDDVHVTPAAGQGRVFIGSIDEGLLALDSRIGEALWTTLYEGEVWGSPVLANGVVYAGTDAGQVGYGRVGRALFSTHCRRRSVT